MHEPLQQLSHTLKSHRQSITKPRQIIFFALQDHGPLTMQQLAGYCKEVDRASIYRSIALFEKLGIVQRLQFGWKYKLELSDAFHYHHHHLTCLRCGAMSVLPEDSQLERRLKHVAADQKFVMQNHQLEIQGVCSACLAEQPADQS